MLCRPDDVYKTYFAYHTMVSMSAPYEDFPRLSHTRAAQMGGDAKQDAPLSPPIQLLHRTARREKTQFMLVFPPPAPDSHVKKRQNPAVDFLVIILIQDFMTHALQRLDLKIPETGILQHPDGGLSSLLPACARIVRA